MDEAEQPPASENEEARTSDEIAPPPGTILIPPGMARRSGVTVQPDEPPPASADTPSPTRTDGTVILEPGTVRRDLVDDSTSEPDAIPAVLRAASNPRISLGSAAVAAPPPPTSVPPTAAVAPAAVPDIAHRQASVAAHRHRRRLAIVLGVLLVGAAAAAVTVVLVLRTNQSSKARIEQAFGQDYDVVLDVLEDSSLAVATAISDIGTADGVDLSPVVQAVDSARTDLEGQALPVETADHANDVQLLRNGVDAHLIFLDTLADLAETTPLGIDDAAVDRVQRSWEQAEGAIEDAFAVRPEHGLPPTDAVATQLDAMAALLHDVAAREQQDSAARQVLTDYRNQVTAVLDRYQVLQDELAARQMRNWTPFGSSVDAYTVFGQAATARYDVAQDLEGIAVPSAFTTLHQQLVDTIRVLARYVDEDAVNAASAAHDYCTFASEEYDCVRLGDTPLYESFVRTTQAIGADFDRMTAELFALLDSEHAAVS